MHGFDIFFVYVCTCVILIVDGSDWAVDVDVSDWAVDVDWSDWAVDVDESDWALDVDANDWVADVDGSFDFYSTSSTCQYWELQVRGKRTQI